jgi:hypothetical protein
MRADAPRRGGWWPALTTARVVVWIVVAAGVLVAAFAGHGEWLIPTYAILVLATAAALASARQEPGSWLGRRAVRRGLVAAIGAVCAGFLAGTFRPSATTVGVYLLVLLVLLDVAVGRATQRLATASEEVVDERQEGLRNRAHRLAYWLLAVVVGGTVVVAQIAGSPGRSWLEGSLASGGTVVLVQLLFGLPAMVIAWTEPDRLAPEVAAPALDARTALALRLLALTIAMPFLLSALLAIVPVRTTSWVSPQTFAASHRLCREFMGSASVGIGVQASLPLHATACWDGEAASPAWGLNESDCNIAGATLATVETSRCSRVIGPDGTLRFTYGATVTPALLPFLRREVTVSLVLDRDGRVERLP